jgi:hypothetical protein
MIIEPAAPAVITHTRVVIDIRDAVVIDVVNDGFIHVANSGVVVKSMVAPVAALIPIAVVAVTVIHSAVKPDVGTPVAVVPVVAAAIKAPVTRRPQRSDVRRHDPFTRDPVITSRGIRPVAWSPDVVIARALRLIVIGQRGRRIRRDIVCGIGIVRRWFSAILLPAILPVVRSWCAALIRWLRRGVFGTGRGVAGVGQIHSRRVIAADRLVLIAVAARQGQRHKYRRKCQWKSVSADPVHG